MSIQLSLHVGDILKLRGNNPQAPHLQVVGLVDDAAEVFPVVEVEPGVWARTHGRMQTVPFERFTAVDWEVVGHPPADEL